MKPSFKHYPYEGCYRIHHNGNEGIIVKHWQGDYSWRAWHGTTLLGLGTTRTLADARSVVLKAVLEESVEEMPNPKPFDQEEILTQEEKDLYHSILQSEEAAIRSAERCPICGDYIGNGECLSGCDDERLPEPPPTPSLEKRREMWRLFRGIYAEVGE
jgi:hypothetical protein